jgi:hypothetical protein
MKGGKAGKVRGGGKESNNGSREGAAKPKSRSRQWDIKPRISKQEAQPGSVTSAHDMDPVTTDAQNVEAGSPMEPKATSVVDSQKSNLRPLKPNRRGTFTGPGRRRVSKEPKT